MRSGKGWSQDPPLIVTQVHCMHLSSSGLVLPSHQVLHHCFKSWLSISTTLPNRSYTGGGGEGPWVFLVSAFPEESILTIAYLVYSWSSKMKTYYRKSSYHLPGLFSGFSSVVLMKTRNSFWQDLGDSRQKYSQVNQQLLVYIQKKELNSPNHWKKNIWVHSATSQKAA